MQNPKKKCVFCGQNLSQGKAGNLAREHVFPQWLQKRLGAYGAPFESLKANHETGQVDHWSLNLLTFVAKRVCRSCNGGWMRDLEVAVAPYFEELITKRKMLWELSNSEQDDLQRWAFKTALAVLIASPLDDRHPPEEHFRSLLQGLQIPSSIHVVASQIVGSENDHGFAVLPSLSITSRPDEAFLDTELLNASYMVVMQFGTFICAVIYCPSDIYTIALHQEIHVVLGRLPGAYKWYRLKGHISIPRGSSIETWTQYLELVRFLSPAAAAADRLTTPSGTLQIVPPPYLDVGLRSAIEDRDKRSKHG